MTLHDAERLLKHQAKRPALRDLVEAIAKCLGIDFSPTDRKPQYMTAEAFKAFVDATDQGRTLGIGQR